MITEMTDLKTTETTYPRNGLGKKIMTAALAVLLFTAVITAVASATTIWVSADEDQTIQQAVTSATAGDTIIVRDGTYRENVDVNVTHLTIRSENGSANCIVNASVNTTHVFNVQQDYVNITGFTVTNATVEDKAGIYLSGREHCNISENNASNNYYGIWLYSSSNNTLTNNTANSNDWGGILLHTSSNNNTLTSNTANSNNYHGILLHTSSNNNTLTSNTANSNNRCGIYLNTSSSNNLTSNTANSNNMGGIVLHTSSSNNNVSCNWVQNNKGGIVLHTSSNNNNVSCNWVQNNSMSGFRLIEGSTGNTIENNNIIVNGVYNDTSGGYEYQFYNGQSDNVEVKNNFWGYGMNDSKINASIYDWQDDPSNCGNVTFDKRDGPSPCAPIPELPTILLFGIGLVALAGYIRTGRKKDE